MYGDCFGFFLSKIFTDQIFNVQGATLMRINNLYISGIF